jgi:hypothetical protein
MGDCLEPSRRDTKLALDPAVAFIVGTSLVAFLLGRLVGYWALVAALVWGVVVGVAVGDSWEAANGELGFGLILFGTGTT